MDRQRSTNVLAIGAGPANLSLAALADPFSDLSVALVESRKSVSWHPGLLWSNSRLQVSGVKDLVSLVDPRSRFSFLNFLHENGRLYRHLIANVDYVSRKEFDQYFTWAAQLLGVYLDETVQAVDHDGRGFVVRTGRGQWHADNLVLGVGQVPSQPECVRGIVSSRLWHASRHLDQGLPLSGKHVLLVGGGQSGAEVALDMLSGRTGLPRRLTWVTGRDGFSPLDDSPFANDWFNPSYVRYFYELSSEQRSTLLGRQRAAVCGVTRELLALVYKRLYEIDYLTSDQFSHQLLAGVELSELAEVSGAFRGALLDTVTGRERPILCDVVVLATGFTPRLPSFMEPLHDRMPRTDDGYQVARDYRVPWDGPDTNRIYVQNGARTSHGVADPNLSLAAWRSATIINSLLDRECYSLKEEDITLSLD
ncbi:lysine N6-hydroxylase [Amycolatopsis arida]|uniref:L-lysine N6-monooxygenase MbtG n=1 Tax=Amycolatopsis arida TaxID=587909 RepID=A0A1I5Q9H2_9PSEU|nr:SidA/IucD/PvdA family monooxygenase [Amycolatopsis arida]TDX98763.1 lysine N6-hydroxylase [Amycolatopsis arida]SFP42913.1 lysine N6-hydroxylase [Amycolatopsis arida]